MKRTKLSCSLPIYRELEKEYGGFSAAAEDCRALGLDGIEAVWGGDDAIGELPKELVVGYHLLFYPDWLDFWRGDKNALRRKFGSVEAANAFYGGNGPECLVAQYRADLARAVSLGAEYVVYHVSDVSIEEGYTYRWEHTDEQVIDAAAELINLVMEGQNPPLALLVENQWWPGFTFLEPEKTERLLGLLRHENKGILLDTGHLMNTNTALAAEREGAEYISAMLDRHGALSGAVRGIHLHQSLSGAYVRKHTGRLPDGLPEDYIERFGVNYAHILRIDQHRPWTDTAIVPVLERIAPEWITNELSADSRGARQTAVRAQMDTLRRGGFAL